MKKYIDYLREFIGLGSSGGGGGGFMPSGSININKNGHHKVAQYTDAVVNVPNPSKGTLSIDENGTYDVTTKASVVVDIGPYGVGSKTITRNKSNENVSTYETANVQVQGGDDGTTPMTVTCPSGYTEIRTTESFLESTVNSWKAGSRTPALRCGADVTVVKGDKCGYIGIKQGTAYEFCVYGTVYSVSNYTSYKRVTITIAGVVHGDAKVITITENGTYNMKARESAIVNVASASGTKTITTNGTHDVASYASAKVDVPTNLVQYDGITMFSEPIEGSTVDIMVQANLSVDAKVGIYGYASRSSSGGAQMVPFVVFGTVKTVKSAGETYEIQVQKAIEVTE